MNLLEHRTPVQVARRICHWFFWLCVLPSSALIAIRHGDNFLNFIATLLIGTVFFVPLVFIFVWSLQKGRLAWENRTPTMKLEDDARNDKYFEQVASELKSHDLKPGVWAKALANSEGDENKAKAFYIKMRVRQLVDAGVETAAESGQNYPKPQARPVPPSLPPQSEPPSKLTHQYSPIDWIRENVVDNAIIAKAILFIPLTLIIIVIILVVVSALSNG